jgi:hypothetical protein
MHNSEGDATMAMNGAYFNGLDANGQQSALANIPGSVTTDYILFSLNVASDTSADINYGWNFGCVLARDGRVTPELDKILTPVVRAGVDKGKCQRVWLTIGAAVWHEHQQQTSPFTNVQNILNSNDQKLKTSLLENFGAIAQALTDITGVKEVGFDMDYEEYGDLASAVTDVTVALYNQLQCPITFCPYQGLYKRQSPWITALRQVHSAVNKGTEKKIQPVVGFNLQTYAGGSGNDPAKWVDAIKDAKDTGVSDSAAFVWPIVSCDLDATPVTPPEELAKKLKGWKSKGASLWATQPPNNPPPDLKAYGEAIAQGIT